MGGGADVKAMVLNEGIEVVVDLREEATECAYPTDQVKWIKVPLDDDTKEYEAKLLNKPFMRLLEHIMPVRRSPFIVVEARAERGLLQLALC